ncbi:CbiX/SirB N-terminal domain-containing protein, partial [Georgenia sp. 10Sc9-8]|nr:CbiX/SirB N-terminal domain-containing protein [Georgenia halotolerans]
MSTVAVAPGSRDRTTEQVPALVACSHGTSDPDGRAAIAALVRAVAARLTGVTVLPSFVDVQDPDVPTTLAQLDEATTHIV